jgi:hypothetical protein
LALLQDSLAIFHGQGKLWFYRFENLAGFMGLLDKPAESACAILTQFQQLVLI